MDDNETGYYTVLGIERTNDRGTIWKAFREIGTNYLPEEGSENISQNSIKFAKICEAYEVLSTPELKEVYDNFGEKILKNGLPSGIGHPGYAFNGDWYGNSLLSFLQNSLNSNSSLESFITALKRPLFTTKEEAKKQAPRPKKDVEDLVVELKCNLRELYNGCLKTINYKKEKLLHYSGRKTESIHWEKEIEVRPGYTDGYEIVFQGEGHDAVGKHSGDLIVRISQLKDDSFERHGNHLVYTMKIKLDEAFLPESLQVVTLDDRILNISVNETISQETATVVSGEGMPILDLKDPLASLEKRFRKGDLIVKYDVEFPKFLSASQKQKMSQVLKQ